MFRYLPKAWAPYIRLARLDRPLPILLTLFPCWAALFQAAGGIPNFQQMLIFSLGAFVMRSAGCTVNDIADREFDGHVERTQLRPLPRGEISLTEAVVFLIAQLASAAAFLLVLTPLARWVAIGVLPLVLIYPFCKRFIYWPQAVLGAAFNWGMLLAWAQLNTHVPLGAVLMWAGAVAWQIGYDTLYAYVDVKDDARLGLKSTAILFGRHGKVAIALFYVLALAAWSLGGRILGMSWPYALGMLALGAHLGWQAWRVRLDRPEVNYRLFVANVLTGALLAVAAFVGTWRL